MQVRLFGNSMDLLYSGAKLKMQRIWSFSIWLGELKTSCLPDNIFHPYSSGSRSNSEECSGPIYTIAKGHDNGILMALETHPKTVSWKIEIEFCVE